jgi:hypothetical protein
LCTSIRNITVHPNVTLGYQVFILSYLV